MMSRSHGVHTRTPPLSGALFEERILSVGESNAFEYRSARDVRTPGPVSRIFGAVSNQETRFHLVSPAVMMPYSRMLKARLRKLKLTHHPTSSVPQWRDQPTMHSVSTRKARAFSRCAPPESPPTFWSSG